MMKTIDTLNKMKRNAGMAVDELVLVSVMVGSVSTFGAVAVPWDSVIGATQNVQGVKDLEQIEQANQDFYKLYGKWPHEMTNGQALNNVVVLVNRQGLKFPYSRMEDFKAVLNNMPTEMTRTGLAVRHNLGAGRVLQRPAPFGSGYAMEIVFEGVPLEVAEAIDKNVDGDDNASAGRVRLQKSGNTAHVVYRANKV